MPERKQVRVIMKEEGRQVEKTLAPELPAYKLSGGVGLSTSHEAKAVSVISDRLGNARVELNFAALKERFA